MELALLIIIGACVLLIPAWVYLAGSGTGLVDDERPTLDVQNHLDDR